MATRGKLTATGNMYSITPKPGMLRGMQSQRWTPTGALAELIDNSFGPGRGNATIVSILYDTADRTLTVTDNGRGMEYIGRLFQLGNTIGRTVGDIGYFGSGGTQAIIWLAEWVSVETERDGMVMQGSIRWADVVELDNFDDVAVSNVWRKGSLGLPRQHGTVIKMKLLKSRKLHIGNLLRDLSRLFAPGLRRGKTITWVQARGGEIVDERHLDDPFEVKAAPENTVRFNIVVEHGDEHLPVRGVVSFDDNVSHADSVIHIGFVYREIMRTRDCFRSDNEFFDGIGVSGWLDLGDGWQPYLSTTKDSFDNQPLYDVLMEHVFSQIRGLLIKAQRKAINFELDNIAIGLQIALEATSKLRVSVRREPGTEEEGGVRPDGDGTNVSGEHNPQPDDAGKHKTNAAAHIRLVPQTDDQMKGALARAGWDAHGIFVDLNEEHRVVREAMRRPVNRHALHVIILAEIAALFASDDELLHLAFRKSVIEELDIYEGQEKIRKLIRYLIDSVPEKSAA
jgi:hypothetical protein